MPISCRHRNFALELVSTRGTSIPTGWKLSFLGTLIGEEKKKITGEKAVVVSFRNRKRMMMVSEQGTQIHPEDV